MLQTNLFTITSFITDRVKSKYNFLFERNELLAIIDYDYYIKVIKNDNFIPRLEFVEKKNYHP